MTRIKIYCVTCQKDVEAYHTKGLEIYPHIPDLALKDFYRCPICKNYVGCHVGTRRPLGCIPNKELREARIKAHNFIDQFWKKKRCSRKEIYKILSNHFGYEYHNGNTKSISECEEAIKVIKDNIRLKGENNEI